MTQPNLEQNYVRSMARVKAMRESARPEHDLRLLLAHVNLLDKLDHNEAEFNSQPASRQRSSVEYERKRPNHRRRESHQYTDDDEKDTYDSYHTAVVTSATLVSVEEVEDDD